MTAATDQRKARLPAMNAKRIARARVLRDVSEGRLLLVDVLEDVPEALHGMIVWDFLARLPGCGMESLRTIGARAIRDQINLTWELERLTLAKRYWLLENVPHLRLNVPRTRRALDGRPQG